MEKEKLPGIGPYTLNAINIFALNKDIMTIDTNIRRILIHEFHLPQTVADKKLESLAQQCLPKGRSRDWHNALMDYGATYLTSRKTGIKPKTMQSAFQGSDRQIRAMIVRYIVHHPKRISLSSLYKIIHKTVTLSRLKKIIKGLVKDKMLKQEKGKYGLLKG